MSLIRSPVTPVARVTVTRSETDLFRTVFRRQTGPVIGPYQESRDTSHPGDGYLVRNRIFWNSFSPPDGTRD